MGAYSSSAPEGPKPEHLIIEASTVARNLSSKHPNTQHMANTNHQGKQLSYWISRLQSQQPGEPISPINYERAHSDNNIIEFFMRINRQKTLRDGQYN